MARLFRAKWLLIPAVLILMVGGYAAWNYLSKWESTDDAQVDGHIHPINARVGGTVNSVNVNDNQLVQAGTVVAQIDPQQSEAHKNPIQVRDRQPPHHDGKPDGGGQISR